MAHPTLIPGRNANNVNSGRDGKDETDQTDQTGFSLFRTSSCIAPAPQLGRRGGLSIGARAAHSTVTGDECGQSQRGFTMHHQKNRFLN